MGAVCLDCCRKTAVSLGDALLATNKHCARAWLVLLLLLLVMSGVVGLLQQYITITLYQQQMITSGVEAATSMLGLLSDVNSSSQVRQ